MVKNFEETLANKALRLPKKCNLPTKHSYRPEMDCTGELKADGLQLYQELIGYLCWVLEIIRVAILLETTIISKHLGLPREGHLEQVFHIVGYLKRRKKLRLLFDSGYPTTNEKLFKKYDWLSFYRDAKEAIPNNMPESKGRGIVVTFFVDTNHEGNLKYRKSQTGVIIFINKASMHWYIKSQTTVEASTFEAKLCAMKIAV